MSLEELIHCQRIDLEHIKKVWINYQKSALQRRTSSNIQACLRDLDKFAENCRTRHYRITAHPEAKESNEYFKQDQYSDIVEAWETVRDNLHMALDAMTGGDSEMVKTVAPSTSVAQLPLMPLPKFAGDLTAWHSFRDLFVSLVHNRQDLSNVQKLHYLKISLVGDAELHWRNVELTEDNYLPAWEALCAEFDSVRLILYAHFEELLAIAPVGRNSSSDLSNIRKRAINCYKAIENLKRPIGSWVDLFVYLVIKKFDRATAESWELELKDANTLPSYQQLIDFLAVRIRVTADHSTVSVQNLNLGSSRAVRNAVVRAHQTNVSGVTCFVCQDHHPLFQCPEFLKRSVQERSVLLRRDRRCFNCFKQGHLPKDCSSKHSCKKCKRRHHSLLHADSNASSSSQDGAGGASHVDAPASLSLVSHHSATIDYSETAIPTATVLLLGPSGAQCSVRAILDPAAQASFVDDEVAREIGSPRVRVDVVITGTGVKGAQRVKAATYITVRPLDASAPSVLIKGFVIKRVSRYSAHIDKMSFRLPDDLMLADRADSTPTPVQLIIGADYLGAFILPEIVRLPDTYAYLQRSTCGWVLVGNPSISKETANEMHAHGSIIVSHTICVRPVLDELARFWEIEEVPIYSQLSSADQFCEEHFCSTYTRLQDGRYCVRLPLIGERKPEAKGVEKAVSSSYSRLELRLEKNAALGREYNTFLQEHLQLGHMERIPAEEERKGQYWYLPHHAVIKHDGSEKLRVVFNASFSDRFGISLNDVLRTGPKLQADIAAILLRWRLFRFVATTDISKMFRQILIHPEDRDWQRIFWRPTPQEEVSSFRLKTVTYGTACAPFLANRVLQQLAVDEGSRYPLAATILRRCVYVDDLLFGSNDLMELREACSQLREMLLAGGFPTHKWRSNIPESLPALHQMDLGTSSLLPFAEDNTVRVLGIAWKPRADDFTFTVEPLLPVSSKRTFLSLLAKCYDPLGWLTPVIIVGKTIMQVLWQRKVEWDSPLPPDIAEKCSAFQQQLSELNQTSIPRWTGWSSQGAKLQLFGFADASNVAYAASVYLRVQTNEGSQISLVYAKSRVAPLKTLSVPRLELCAALLLVRAVKYVIESIAIPDIPVFLFSDSTVALAWIASCPSRWKVFVANRVAEIQNLLPQAQWSHVATEENPADCASRGLLPSPLLSHSLWWYGPAWLTTFMPNDRTYECVPPCTEEERRGEVSCHSTGVELFPFSDFSSWPRLLRVVAYIYRFALSKSKPRVNSRNAQLSVSELEFARNSVCRLLQNEFLSSNQLTRDGNTLQVSDKYLMALSPFLDEDGLIRVGGRLRHSNLPSASKFPILLPDSHVSRLIIRHYHLAMLHGGLQVTLRLVRRSFWILRARSLVKQYVRSCVTCVRHRAALSKQLMGDLPPARVTPSRPFTHTGVDYAGPIQVRLGPGRGRKSQKAYCAVFVCLCTRAIHLECVSDCSTNAFLAAFHRFTSRRGLPAVVYSDNGSNFVGADRELRRSVREACQDSKFVDKMTSEGVRWNFIPPASPHFGGLWEAGVKSLKHHLRRVLGASTPTFEELTTLLCQIEGILNSRPIMPLRDDPESFDALTPGHFLVGTAVKEPAAPNLIDVSENRLSRWQVVQRQKQQFWKAWSNDYLNTIRQRAKWNTVQSNLAVNDLVIVKSPHAPPAHWEMGRVSKTFPGSDGLVRVVEVRTSRNTIKRPISQLCKLPITNT